MKKLILLLGIIAGTALLVYSGSITVTFPGTGSFLYKGETYKITWTNNGCSSPAVKINIFKNSIDQANFVEQLTSSTGNTKSWKVPLNYASGKYVIRVKTDPAEAGCIGDSGVFEIKSKMNLTPTFVSPKLTKKPIVDLAKIKGFIKVSSPAENKSYEVNKPMLIIWGKNIGSYTKVDIFLCTVKDDQGEKIYNAVNNTGMISWTPPSGKVTWPGNEPYIRIATHDNMYSGKSGLFKIVPPALTPPPPPAGNKVIAITAVINNEQTSNVGGNGDHDCMTAPHPAPGRAANAGEIKTGHFRDGGKYKDCNWWVEYYFHSNLTFDLSKIKGKEVVRAELMISLHESIMKSPSGTLATNEYCNSESKLFANSSFIKTFSIFEEGVKKKIDLLDPVRNWAMSGPGGQYKVMIKGMHDYVNNETSVCLRYYGDLILFVEYKE